MIKKYYLLGQWLLFTVLHFTEAEKSDVGKNLLVCMTVSCFHYHS